MTTYKSKNPKFPIYRIEIHTDSITVYDRVDYQHPSHNDIINFFIKIKKLKIHRIKDYVYLPDQNNQWHITDGVNENLTLFKKSSQFPEWTVYASHEKPAQEKRFHPNISVYDIIPMNRAPHLHFTKNTKITHKEISTLMTWLSEYANVSATEIWEQFPKLKDKYFPAPKIEKRCFQEIEMVDLRP